MVKVNKAVEKPEAPLWPIEQDSIYKIKIDRNSQKFYVEDLEYGKFDEFTFRTLDTYNKLKAYNSDFSKTEIESTLFKFSGDARDSHGSQKTHIVKEQEQTYECCGRVIPTELTKAMSEEDRLKNKEAAKWYSFIFGIAYIKGKSPILCDYQLSGGSIKEAGDILKKIKEEKKDYHKAELRFRASKNPNEDQDWPEIEVTADFSRDLPVSGLEPYFDTVKAYVDDHNDKIDVKAEKFKKYGGKPYVPNKFTKKKW